MGILALAADERVAEVVVTEDELTVRLMDGRTITVPLAWFPRLLGATEEQRNNWRVSGGGYGIHWEDVDEDLSTEGLLRGSPVPARPITQVKNHHTDDEDSTIQASDEEGEKGLLDHLSEVEESGAELTAVLKWIYDETVTVGEKVNLHASRVNQLNAMGGAVKAGDLKKIMLMAASDMNTFSKMIEGVLPNFERRVKKLDTALTAIVLLADPRSAADAEQISFMRSSLSEMLDSIQPAKISMKGFRESALGLSQLNISKDLTRAANRQAKAIDGIMRNMEEVESFALRVNFQIEEKYRDLPNGDEEA